MSMEEGCCICDVSDASDFDPLVYCDECNLAVHKLCYGISVIPEDDWFCNTVSIFSVYRGGGYKKHFLTNIFGRVSYRGPIDFLKKIAYI